MTIIKLVLSLLEFATQKTLKSHFYFPYLNFLSQYYVAIYKNSTIRKTRKKTARKWNLNLFQNWSATSINPLIIRHIFSLIIIKSFHFFIFTSSLIIEISSFFRGDFSLTELPYKKCVCVRFAFINSNFSWSLPEINKCKVIKANHHVNFYN